MAKTKANEREFAGQVISWIQERIAQGGLPFENATQDSGLYGLEQVKFPDILVTLDFECQRPFCGWELKTPKTDARDAELLTRAVEKAQTLDAKYFVTWNMQTVIIWSTPEKTRAIVTEGDKVREFGPDPRITDVNDIRNKDKADILREVCRRLLLDLGKLYEDERINLPLADTTIFVSVVGTAAEKMAGTLAEDLRKARADRTFDRRLSAWAAKQGVNRYDQEYWETLSQQIAYKIIAKVLFYITLGKQNMNLPRLDLGGDNWRVAITRMRHLFQLGLEVDYQAVFEPDITDEIEMGEATAKVIIELCENLRHWSFELMPLDVIGTVFERLVPEDARHSLGQYFTPDNLVDLIATFCVRGCDDYVMDPTCGTGTFLIRGYNRLRHLQSKMKAHHEILKQVWGFDIAGFPAELATINLYRQDLSDYLNFPRVLSKDFFEVMPGQAFEFPPPKKNRAGQERVQVGIPKFDALVGNFPFIRQELIEKVNKGYKEGLERVLFESWAREYPELFRDGNDSNAHKLRLSGQADIYAYMFFHAAAHLKVGGRMGFVTSNSWLDVAYGYELQKFFLSKFKVVAICESRCEPWFGQSAVNTVFTVLERCDNENAKNSNPVRFVKIKKPLKELFPQDSLTDTQARWIRLEQFVDKVEGISAPKGIPGRPGADGYKEFGPISAEYVKQPEIVSYEDEEMRVRMIRQGDLRDEVERAGQTVKWGQYLRGPDTYFEVLEGCADKFVPLGKVAEIRRGITTGINEFFYVNEDKIKHWGIEREFLKPVIKTPKESERIKLRKQDLKWFAFLCHKSKSELLGTGALKYIKWGEKQKTTEGKLWPEVASVKGRRRWYELPRRIPGLVLLPMVTGESLRCMVNTCRAQVDHNLFEVISEDRALLDALGVYLNSAWALLQRELTGRVNLGDGALKVEGIDWERILIPKRNLLLRAKRNVGEAFEALCSRRIKPIGKEARSKDRLIFERAVAKSLRLVEESAEKALKGVVELVEERHLLPKLRSAKKKGRKEQDIEKLKEEVIDEVLPNGVVKFPDGFVRGKVAWREVGVAAESVKLGASFFEKQDVVDGEGRHLMEAGSIAEGKFVVYAKKRDELVVRVPERFTAVRKAVQDYEIYVREIREKLYKAIMEKSGDHNLSESLARGICGDFGLPDVR